MFLFMGDVAIIFSSLYKFVTLKVYVQRNLIVLWCHSSLLIAVFIQGQVPQY